jgi:hypothetical protein
MLRSKDTPEGCPHRMYQSVALSVLSCFKCFFSYLIAARMLRSKDTPEGCSPRMYQSVALSVLSCFVADEEIMTNPSVLFNLPELLGMFCPNIFSFNAAYRKNCQIHLHSQRFFQIIICTYGSRLLCACEICKRASWKVGGMLRWFVSLKLCTGTFL